LQRTNKKSKMTAKATHRFSKNKSGVNNTTVMRKVVHMTVATATAIREIYNLKTKINTTY
jgi:hypothetical protein